MTEVSLRARIDQLLAGMTLAEKAGQLILSDWGGFQRPVGSSQALDRQRARVEAALGRGGVGSLVSVPDPVQINRLQRLAMEGSPSGIPALFGFPVIHGLRTIFPVPIAMAATWDPELIERSQSVAAREARAVGIHWTFAPAVDVARDPLWGRTVEGAGEDPFLGAAVAAAQVRGFQGRHPGGPDGLIVGPKHLAGAGAGVGAGAGTGAGAGAGAGAGVAPGGRDCFEVTLSDSQLWNVYLPPFEAALAAGAETVIAGCVDLNGAPVTGTRWLCTDVLRGTWGFGGFVVSDTDAVRHLVTHGFAQDLTDAGARAVGAGVDLEMAITDPAFAQLPQAVRRGRASAQAMDASVRRVLEAKLRMGLFEEPCADPGRARQVLSDPAHRQVARIAAERSAVLLRNARGFLPFATGTGSIAVIGPLADSARDTLGPWCFDADLDETVTVLAGIRRRAGQAARVGYAPGLRDESERRAAVDLAAGADVAVVVIGERQTMISEAASRSSLALPGGQAELLQAVVATGTPVALLVMSGRPVDLHWASEHVPAILDIWYPGTQGGTAVANLLFGDACPGGKLPFTWPGTAEHGTSLFPFGYGLSYARFAYSNLTADRDVIGPGESLIVSVTVTNTADRDADEVVQLYLHQRHASESRPVRELKGFQRVSVQAGQSHLVQFTVGPAQRRYWNGAARDWVTETSTFDVWIGGDSTAELCTTFEVTD